MTASTVFSAAFVLLCLSLPVSSIQPSAGCGYEVWASDQSNSAPDQTALGVKGGYLWIWDSGAIETQLGGGADATPLTCCPHSAAGPCDMLHVFPQTLVEYSQDGTPTGRTLGELEGFGRLHGVIQDPQGRYVNVNLFTKGGGYVGIIDTVTKEAIALFRVTKFNYSSTASRSVHMSFWVSDGDAIIVGNLHGKAIERIDVVRDASGTITSATLNKSATLGLGKNMSVAEEATYFGGENAYGNPLIGVTAGAYDRADLGDLTPNGVCKEDGCAAGADGAAGGRKNNLPICPLTSTNNRVYSTLAGGGLLIADPATTPMSIVGEYGNNIIYGAGCGGVQVADKMFLNPGVSASKAGGAQSMFGLFAFDDTAYSHGHRAENEPMPDIVFRDAGNTLTGGNQEGSSESDTSGQIPGSTTRRDSHGATVTTDDRYVHVVDRIQNLIEVFDAQTYKRSTYDLTSESGRGGNEGAPGACRAKSVTDDAALPLNDPAPDLMERTPDGKYLCIALRGPAPVSVPHAAQGSCPGVGVVQLSSDGRGGKLVAVLRTSNTVPDAVPITASSFPGGIPYSGDERSDVHGAIVISKPNSGC